MGSQSASTGSGLQIGIVGAGVAGLSAAIALRRIGHNVEVFERSEFKNENGAAVSIPPNGGRILDRWGFDAIKAGGIEMVQVRRPKGDTLEPMAPTLSFANVEQQFGSKWHFYHRVDMHRHLREMSEQAGAIIRLGCQVMDVEPDSGMIELKDGSTVQKDLVIIADGQHDRLNAKITGKDVPMMRSGQTAYRCLIPMKDILEDEITKPLFENQAPGFWAPALPAKGVMAVTYPCRNNEILNVIAVHRKLGQHASTEDDVTIEDWNFPATHEDLEAVLDGFHPSVKRVFLKSPEVKVYTQMKRAPLDKMTRGKALLIGDACHPMLLTHAQGVSSSIEDAAALELFLANVPASSSVSSPPTDNLLERLQQFEAFRLPRVSATQILTEPVVPGPQAAANHAKQEAEIRKHYSGPLPPTGSMPHSPPICQFFFGYDVRKEGLIFLEETKKAPLQVQAVTIESSQPVELSSEPAEAVVVPANGSTADTNELEPLDEGYLCTIPMPEPLSPSTESPIQSSEPPFGPDETMESENSSIADSILETPALESTQFSNTIMVEAPSAKGMEIPMEVTARLIVKSQSALDTLELKLRELGVHVTTMEVIPSPPLSTADMKVSPLTA